MNIYKSYCIKMIYVLIHRWIIIKLSVIGFNCFLIIYNMKEVNYCRSQKFNSIKFPACIIYIGSLSAFSGLSDPQALNQAVSAYQACHFVGMPECDVGSFNFIIN